jgi:hypothetical protein
MAAEVWVEADAHDARVPDVGDSAHTDAAVAADSNLTSGTADARVLALTDDPGPWPNADPQRDSDGVRAAVAVNPHSCTQAADVGSFCEAPLHIAQGRHALVGVAARVQIRADAVDANAPVAHPLNPDPVPVTGAPSGPKSSLTPSTPTPRSSSGSCD